MHDLTVRIEISGEPVTVGNIHGENPDDACFSYAPDYLRRPNAAPISLSLPLSDEAFSPERTRTFFEGLLPEGFTRREVARKLHANENDYLTILSELGSECIGAIQILAPGKMVSRTSYEELSKEKIRRLAE